MTRAYRYLLGDFEPYIFKTEDYGESWERLTDGANGIPSDFPTRVVREDPDREGLLYAGTEFGIFISFDDGAHWESLQLNLPVTPVTDIKVYRQDLALSTMGRSFWIMDNVTPLHEIKDGLAEGRNHLFTPRNAYRVQGGGGFGFGGRDPSAPQYSPSGATIDYYLAEEPSGGLTLEILDSSGDVVRSYRSGGQGASTRTTQGMRAPQRQAFGATGPDASPGMHRFVWDLRVAGAAGGRGGGPIVVPGEYQVRLGAAGWADTRPFLVLMDPRAEADGVTIEDLKAQFEFNQEVSQFQTVAQEAAQRISDALGSGTHQGRALEQLRELEALMVDRGGSYPQPMLLNQINYLRGMTSRADQRPGNFAYSRLEELREQLDEIQRRLSQILGEDL
jgi:hypothetical protein